jgi:Domain of unknown function (DUF4160)
MAKSTAFFFDLRTGSAVHLSVLAKSRSRLRRASESCPEIIREWLVFLVEVRAANQATSLVPTILTVGPYRFFFYSADGGEPPHVHVERERSSAKFWIHPVALARSFGFARSELLDIQRIVAENEQKFRKAWDDYFGNR